MKRKNPERIPTDTVPTPLASPFTNLNLIVPELPNGQNDAPQTEFQNTSPPTVKRGTVLLQRQTAHRHGGCVIVLCDFSQPHSITQLEDLARDLKKHCGAGGTVKNHTIEIQGEHLQKIRSRLLFLGYNPRGEK